MGSTKEKRNLFTLSIPVITIISVILIGGWKQTLQSAPAYQSHEEVVAGAKKEGKMVIWTQMAKGEELLIYEDFKKEYPFIKIETVVLRAEECRERLLMEAEAGRKPTVDTFDIAPMHLPLYQKKGLLLSFPWVKVYKMDPRAVDPANMAVANHAAVEVFGYNTNRLSSEKLPKSYEDLLKPEWKGGQMLLDIRGFLWDKLAASGAWTEEKTLDFCRKLLEQKPQFGKGQTNISQLLAAGMTSLAVTAVKNLISMKRKGAPVDWVPLEPIVGDLGGYSIHKDALHPNSAILFLGWLSGPQGQKSLEKYAGKSLPYPGVGTEESRMYEGKKLAIVDWNDVKQAKLLKMSTAIMELWGAK